jgi:lysophospholipase L1-like esterase
VEKAALDRRYFVLRVRKGPAFAALTLLLVLAALEAGQRVSDWRKLRKRGPVNDVYAVRGETASGIPLSDKRGGLVLVHEPYLLYKHKAGRRVVGPFGDETVSMTINAQGFRGPDWPREKAPGTARAIVLGGSAAFGHGASADEKVFHALLERALAARAPAGRRVEVLNAATVGYESRQELVSLETELLDYAPDAIVLFDGWNDWFYASTTTDPRGGTHRIFYELEAAIARGQETGLNVLRLSAFYRGLERKMPDAWAALAELARRKPEAPRAPAAGGEDVAPAAASPDEAAAVAKYGEYYDHADGHRRYRRTLEEICRLARAYGIRVVIAPQPELFQRREPVPEAEQVERARQPESYARVVRARYPAYVDAAREVAAAEGALFCDCSRAFDDAAGEVAFIDRVHFNDRGNEIIARRLEPVVARALGLGGD